MPLPFFIPVPRPDSLLSPYLGRLDDFCSFPKADVATPTSIGQVWDKSVIRDHARERQVSVEADVRGFAAIVPGMNNLGR